METPAPIALMETDLATTALRLTVATVLGCALGLERERRDRAAGLRTYALTSLAACLFTLLCIEMAATLTLDDRVVADPLRVIEAVTAGVAFLAAGTIIAVGREVRGITTGAGMWLAGALGVGIGIGAYAAATMAAVLGLVVLGVLRWVDQHVGSDT